MVCVTTLLPICGYVGNIIIWQLGHWGPHQTIIIESRRSSTRSRIGIDGIFGDIKILRALQAVDRLWPRFMAGKMQNRWFIGHTYTYIQTEPKCLNLLHIYAQSNNAWKPVSMHKRPCMSWFYLGFVPLQPYKSKSLPWWLYYVDTEY